MPVDLTRPNVSDHIQRVTYGRGVRLFDSVMEFLQGHRRYGFSADAIAARIDEPASAVMVEHVLSHHPDKVSYTKSNGRLYWYVEE